MISHSPRHHHWSLLKIMSFGLLVVAAGFSYHYLVNQASVANAEDMALPPSISDILDPAHLALLEKIESITLDDALFSDAAFNSLRDNTVVLTPLPVGRANPFAPYTAASAKPTKSGQ